MVKTVAFNYPKFLKWPKVQQQAVAVPTMWQNGQPIPWPEMWELQTPQRGQREKLEDMVLLNSVPQGGTTSAHFSAGRREVVPTSTIKKVSVVCTANVLIIIIILCDHIINISKRCHHDKW